MSKCRQMNKFYCDIIKIRRKYWEKKKTKHELKSPIHKKVYTESCIRCFNSNTGKYDVETFSIEKLRKYPIETYINLNGKNVK